MIYYLIFSLLNALLVSFSLSGALHLHLNLQQLSEVLKQYRLIYIQKHSNAKPVSN